MHTHGNAYNDISPGETFGATVTVTESHIVMGAGLFGDFNPLHVNETFAKETQFGTRILHGPFTSALISASVGNFFAGTAVAYLEHNCKFKAPVRAGDTLTTTWTDHPRKARQAQVQRRHRGDERSLPQPREDAGGRGKWKDYGNE